MPNVHSTLSSLFTDIANAIRAKTGSQAQIVADNFPTEIANISTGIDPSDATATDGDILSGKTAYLADGTKHTGSMTDRGSVDVTLDTTTTSYTVPSGKHSGSGTVKVVTQTKSATPTTSAQTVSADSGKVLSSVSVSAIQTQTKSVTPSTSAQTVTPDSGKYLTSVNVGAIPNQKSGKQGDITPSSSAQTVYVPSGWHDGNTYFNVEASSGGITTTRYTTTTHTEREYDPDTGRLTYYAYRNYIMYRECSLNSSNTCLIKRKDSGVTYSVNKGTAIDAIPSTSNSYFRFTPSNNEISIYTTASDVVKGTIPPPIKASLIVYPNFTVGQP